MPTIFVRPPNFKTFCSGLRVWMVFRADSRFAPSQWETALLCNAVSHWLSASLESFLVLFFPVAMQTVWASFCVRVVFHPITEVSVGQLANGCIREGVMAPALGMAGVRDEPPTYGTRWGHHGKGSHGNKFVSIVFMEIRAILLETNVTRIEISWTSTEFNSYPTGQNGHHFTMTFSNAFPRMKNCAFWFEFHWSLLARVQLTKSLHWLR